MQLIIAEKPSVGRSIASVLGGTCGAAKPPHVPASKTASPLSNSRERGEVFTKRNGYLEGEKACAVR